MEGRGWARGKGAGGRGRGRAGRGGKANAASGGSKERPIKARLRALERLVSKGSLPADVQAAKQAEIAALKGDVQRQSRVSREKHFSKKYHGVKFIERRKVEKKIAQVEKRLAAARGSGGGSSSSEMARLETDLREAQHDLLYIQHFPRAKKYLSLFPTSEADDAYVVKRRTRIRALIVRRVEAGLPVGRVAEDDDADAGEGSAQPASGALGDDFFDVADDEGDEWEDEEAAAAEEEGGADEEAAAEEAEETSGMQAAATSASKETKGKPKEGKRKRANLEDAEAHKEGKKAKRKKSKEA